jgi:RND family efflux transporter MFP subunit
MKNKTMNRTTYVLLGILAVALISACSTEPEGELETLVAERDSLKTVQKHIESRIVEIESLISALDSTGEKTLVTTYQPAKGVFNHYFEVYGNVQSDQAATLYPESPGLVQKILVNEGQRVNKEQALIQLDAEIIQRNINELTTSLDLANTLYEKQKRLWDQNIGSEVQYLEAKNRKESLENSIATLREQSGKSTIRAPFAGVVDKIFPKIGEMASGQAPAVRMVNTDQMYITADVSERYVGKIKEGDRVWAIVNRQDTIQTKIGRVGSFINQNNRTFEIRVEVDDKVASMIPNSLVVLKINDFTAEEAIAIPSSLIMQDGEGLDYIFVAEKNGNNTFQARKRQIKSGMRYMGQTLVLDGIDTNEAIIDKGSRSVRDGDDVEIMNM